MSKYKENKATGKKGVFICEDWTQLRLKLKDFLKDKEGVTNVYTIDGNIHCTKNGRKCVVASPDDLFKLDLEPNYEKIGINSLV